MKTIEECREFLKDKDLSNERIEAINEYLYSLGKLIITKNLTIYDLQKKIKKQ